MKWAVGFLVFIWLVCGLLGAMWLDELEPQYWRVSPKGRVTLARAYNENPSSYPRPN